MKNFSAYTLIVGILGIGLFSAKIYLEKSSVNHTNESRPLKATQSAYQAKSLKLYNLGFANLISGLIWVDLLQKADSHPILNDEVSWEFESLDGITALDPKFDRAYGYGAIFLSVFKRDQMGAKKILEKWVHFKPNYWRANYLLGYHLFFEMNEKEAAAKYLLRAASLEGAPAYLAALGIRMLTDTAGIHEALRLSVQLYPDLQTEEAKDRLRKRIRALNFSFQKHLWEDALNRYRRDFNKEPKTEEELRPFVNDGARELTGLRLEIDLAPEVSETLREKFAFFYNPAKRTVQSHVGEKDPNLQNVDVIAIPEAKK